MIWFVSTQTMKNANTFRDRLNALFAGYGAGYGSSLPASAPDGRLFYVIPGNTPYQYRTGTGWVAL